MTRLLTICLAAFLLAGAASAETVTKTIRAWSAFCDEYACFAEAQGKSGIAGDAGYYALQLSRLPDANSGWMVRFIAREVPPPDGGVITFSVDGAVDGQSGITGMGDGQSFGLTDEAALKILLPALKKGKEAVIGFGASDGERAAAISLSGLAAVMLWMDERQNRVGNSDQVEAVKADPSEGSKIEGAEAEQLKAALLKATHLSFCEWADPQIAEPYFDVQKHQLTAGFELHIVGCTRGAYQPSTVLFLRGAGDLEPLPFADYSDETGWTATLFLAYVEFDPQALILSHYAKFRGVGDCGTSSKFQWTDSGFKLLEYAYKSCPDGESADMNAEIDFPVIYRAK